uniref:Probable membrane transporter protein n=1 Tax=Candidatus Magnetananas rongchengensis TaxID=1463558 RepID=A0A3Q8BTH0_9BACT|nr:magnetosome protein MamEO [Candidatus Magnetananas rongchenensis]
MKKYIISIIIILIATTAMARTPDPALNQLQESISQAIAKVRPSVVSIKAQKQKKANGEPAVWYESIGSGFFVDDRGYIISDYHVVENAENITVSLWRSRDNHFVARVVDADKELDLVLLKIDSNEIFKPAPLGNSEHLEIGEWIISVGSPFGFEHSVTIGIISDLHRRLVIGNVTYDNMIQTDAVINQGNSGGPVIDIHGNIIGVGTAIYAPSGTYIGLGFASPINRVKHFYSRSTGVVLAAATAPVKKEAINMNKRMPNDARHQKFSNCLKCHTITTKSVVSMKAKMPHPPVAGCTKCHILVKDPVAKGPVAVSAVMPVIPIAANKNPLDTQTFGELFKTVILKLILIIMATSILFSMLGLGGGFLYVPILLACGIDFHTAATTSLVLITTAQLSATYTFYRSGLVDLKLVYELEGSTMIGAFLGGMLAHHFNITVLCLMFACTLFLASYFMMQDQSQLAGRTKSVNFSSWEFHHNFKGFEYSVDMMTGVPLTFFVGYMGGMLGVAGGWLIIPIMVVLFNIPMKIAVATSSLMVPITAFAGFLGHSITGHFDPRLALSLSVVAIIGAQIGSRISIGTESNFLRFLFAFVLSAVGLWMIIRIF